MNEPMLLYIDPGTGSMLFSVFIGIISALVFLFRKIFIKIKFFLSGGKAEKISSSKIPFVIFSDHKRYWNLFGPICDEFEKRNVPLCYWTASPDDPALSKKYEFIKTEFIGEGNKAFAKLNMMNAGIVLSTTPGLDVYQWKRSQNVSYYVHIRHSADEPIGYRMFGCDFYDAILLTGNHQERYIRKLEELREESKKETVIAGCPYLDAMKERLEKTPPKASASPVVLLAPTWGESGILSKFGEEILQALRATGYKIIVRPHPQSFTAEKELMERLLKKFPQSENFIWNRDNDNFDVLNESDVLITDFSGIIFDYTFVFDKPLIYADTSYDSSPYDSAWIKEPLWRFESLKRIGKKLDKNDFPQMKEIIDSVISDASYASERKAVRDEAWLFRGEGAKRTVDYILAKSKELKEKKQWHI